MVALAVDAVGKAQFPQRLHDAALIEHAAVPGVFQRLLGAELGEDGFQLPGALQTALVAALAHDIAVAAQGLALGVRPVGQQVDPVLAFVIVAGELGGRDELYPILHRVVVGILHAAQRIVVRDGHGIHPTRAAIRAAGPRARNRRNRWYGCVDRRAWNGTS